MKKNIPHIIFKAIVGSRSYGTSIPTSDTDYKGVYIQNPVEILTFDYQEQINVNKDETYYEVRRFLELLQVANPTVLELLYMPKDCILEKKPIFDLILKEKEHFLTKKCLHSFGGYAIAQIKKAKGLDKKMNWENKRITRKMPIDFIYIYENGKTFSLKKWLEDKNLDQEFCGLVALEHFKNCYAMYYDAQKNKGYKGIILENSNTVRLSSIPKNEIPLGIIYWNIEGYSTHCKDYKEYENWLENRNTQRYVETNNHSQKIDGKNLMHCRRLLDMAKEIATEGTLKVRRENAQEL